MDGPSPSRQLLLCYSELRESQKHIKFLESKRENLARENEEKREVLVTLRAVREMQAAEMAVNEINLEQLRQTLMFVRQR
mmetsp:Transcript_18120/g.20866  ORF Transcript_18120/g.20866 Transcript_18120/m.20866 type:complete len:80 (+) Transcript_18120:17-256(+)